MFPYAYEVPVSKQVRVIMNTDAKNEADDQFAIVHGLLTSKFSIEGLIGAHFGTQRTNNSMEESYQEIIHILDIMGIAGRIPVFRGAPNRLPDSNTPVPSQGAEAIIAQAHREDPRPLFALFLGPLTDMASAYLMDPSIAGKVTCIWVGGGPWPHGGNEFNLANDIHAANVVLQSGIPVWQIPQNVYTMMRVSMAELQLKVRPYGKIGSYLFQQMIDFIIAMSDRLGMPARESWILGDSPAVGLLLDPYLFSYDLMPIPSIDATMHYLPLQKTDKTLRVYRTIDPRYILEDFFSKLALCFPQANSVYPL